MSSSLESISGGNRDSDFATTRCCQSNALNFPDQETGPGSELAVLILLSDVDMSFGKVVGRASLTQLTLHHHDNSSTPLLISTNSHSPMSFTAFSLALIFFIDIILSSFIP